MQPQTYLFFGKSGAGKGTQAKLLQSYLESKGRKVRYIETGEAFRSFVERDSYTAQVTKQRMAEGALLPEFLPIWMWGDFLIHNLAGGEDLILDGIARRPHEAPIIDSALRFYKRTNPHVLYVDVTDVWALARLGERGRSDDTPESNQKRIDWFEWNVVPAMAYFHEHPYYHFHVINGEQSIESVHEDVMKAVGL